jgi:ABC-type glycerol-3-phosphate transport system substrate-binding protein
MFAQQNPDIKVNYTPLDLQLNNEKMVALFNAKAQADAFYVHDSNLGAWVEVGWLQPIDGLPKLKELNDDIFTFNREALFYKGVGALAVDLPGFAGSAKEAGPTSCRRSPMRSRRISGSAD